MDSSFEPRCTVLVEKEQTIQDLRETVEVSTLIFGDRRFAMVALTPSWEGDAKAGNGA